MVPCALLSWCIPCAGVIRVCHGVSGELVVRFDVLFPKYISEDKKAKLRNLLAHPAAAH